MKIPKSHPRFNSLMQRKKIEGGVKNGIVTPAGLVAQGRGEAFDYLLGERTIPEAKKAARAAAALLLSAKKPVVSVNGNSAVLCPKEIVLLAKELDAAIEVNIFYPPRKRRILIAKHLKKFGAKKVFGVRPTKKIGGLSSDRALVDKEGIWKADVVLVMLEDGDRTEALRKNGKKVVAIDLNPMSRTARKANITIVDNVVRAVPLIRKEVKKLKKGKGLGRTLKGFNNRENLKSTVQYIRRDI